VFHVVNSSQDTMHLHTPAEVALSAHMVEFWTSFAATGQPVSRGAPVWPVYAANTDIAMQLDVDLNLVAHLAAKRCDFWDAHNASLAFWH
jgi:carboxylesterase type B